MGPREDKMAKLIAVQTGGYAIHKCEKALEELGFIKGVRLLGSEASVGLVMEAVNPDESQILITGTFHGDEVTAHKMVRQAKMKSPRLSAWWCSATEMVVPDNLYDNIIRVNIRKMDHYRPMIARATSELGMVPTGRQ